MKTENYHAAFVNLDHRTDRLNHMNQQLLKAGIVASRVRGLLPSEYNGDPQKVARMRNRTPGAIGCMLSQMRIMREAAPFGKHAFVMEDDLIFCEDFQKRMTYIENWMEGREWDIIWLGASFHCNPPFWHRVGGSGMPPNCSANLGYDAKTTDDPRMVRTYGAFATFAYIVNKDSCEKMVRLLYGHMPETIGIDFSMIVLQPQLKCFAFVPGCVHQMDNRSDIGSGHTIWSGFLKLNGTLENSAYVYQERMEDFEPTNFNWAECK